MNADSAEILARLAQAVQAVLGSDAPPARRRLVRDALRALLREQERALHATAAPRRRGRPPAAFVRVQRHGARLTLFLGRRLFYDLGAPARLALQQDATTLRLVVVAPPAGVPVIVPPGGMPRLHLPLPPTAPAPLPDGRYQATVAGGVLTIGAPLPPPPAAR